MPSLILVFDFDHTILHNEGDSAVFKHLGVYEEAYDKVTKQKQQWTKVCDEYYSKFTKKQIQEAVETSFQVTQGAIDLMNNIADLQEKTRSSQEGNNKNNATTPTTSGKFPPNITDVHLVLCTDSNEFFIRTAFDKFFPRTKIDLLHTNPVTWEERQNNNNSNLVDHHPRVHWCEKDGHDCLRCNTAGLPNMCKGLCVKRLIETPPYDDPVVFFFGDGYNDHCAVCNLRACDTAFVRKDFSLHKKCIASPLSQAASCSSSSSTSTTSPLLEKGIHDLDFRGVSRLVPWVDGDDLLVAFHEHIKETLATLPRLNILGEDENTFRYYSQKVRIPKTLRDSFANKELSIAMSEETKKKIADLADQVENNLPVCQELFEYGFQFPSSKPTKDKMCKAIGNLPWLHGEIAIHRYLDYIIRGSVKFTEKCISSVQDDYWQNHKLEAMSHALPWICSLIVRHQTIWNLEDEDAHNMNFTSSPGFYRSEFTDLLMHQLQGNIADLCFRSSSDLKNMFEPSLVRDDREMVADFMGKMIWSAATATEKSNRKNKNSSTNQQQQQIPHLVDILVDNAGPELSADLLILAAVLGAARKMKCGSAVDMVVKDQIKNCEFSVRLIVKDRPFYVSDTVPHDVPIALDQIKEFACKEGNLEGDREKTIVLKFVEVMKAYLDNNNIIIESPDWTTKAVEFRDLNFENTMFGTMVPRSTNESEMKSLDWVRKSSSLSATTENTPAASPLTQQETFSATSPLVFLPKTRLVIVKGDLNYRRLVSDRDWHLRTPFHRAVDETIFRHLPVVSVRTLKCEVLVGVRKDVETRLNEVECDQKNDPISGWRVNGKRGAITFAVPRGDDQSQGF